MPGGVPAGVCTCPGGCTCSGGYLPRECKCQGVYLLGCVPAQGGVPAWVVYLPRYSPLWTEFLTHATENITLPQTSFAGGKDVVASQCQVS